jgi:hypothetical protein
VPGDAAHVDPVLLLVHLRQPLEPAAQHVDLCRRGALLRGEHRCCISEQRLHIAGDQQLHATQPVRGGDGAHAAQPAVGGGRAAEAHDDLLRAQVECLVDELAGAGGGGGHGIVARGAADQREPGGASHLDDRRAAMESPLGLHRVAQWAGDRAGAVGAAECFQGALTTVGHRLLDALVAELPAGMPDRSRDLPRRLPCP